MSIVRYMKRVVSFLVVVVMLLSCGKSDDAFIPDVLVNHTITVQEFNIRATNGVLLIPNVGVAGIMLVRSGAGYVAFDQLSTVSPEKGCKVSPDDTGITATDPCTGAKFLLTDGSPQKAPAVRSLKQYRAALQGGQIINITN